MEKALMLTILFHSSKTMHRAAATKSSTQPLFTVQATELAAYLATLTTSELQTAMHISPAKATEVATLYQQWVSDEGTAAIDSFVGDMYSGLQAHSFDEATRRYAQRHMVILSGLYGLLRPLDRIMPYRLEMGYKLPAPRYRNLYAFWADSLAASLPTNSTLINTSSVEYTKAILPYTSHRVITPKFMTYSTKTHQPTPVVIHSKIARGAFAHWILTHRIQDEQDLAAFNDLNYRYQPHLSSPEQPVYLCHEFGGIGLSIRKN